MPSSILKRFRRDRPQAAPEETIAARLYRMFERQLVPTEPESFPATDRMFARLDEADIARILDVLRDELEPASFRHLTQGLPTSDPKHFRRELLRYGTYYLPDTVGAKTGLSVETPPRSVHSMMRGDIFVGDQYSPDLFCEALEDRGAAIVPGGRYLDFGCSSGAAVRYLQAAYPESEWHGCDPVASSIEWAWEHLPAVRFAISPQWPPLPYGDATFDGVYAISIWSHFSERAALAWFDEMARVIKPGGLLMFTTCGVVTLNWGLKAGLRSNEGLNRIADDLAAGRFRFEDIDPGDQIVRSDEDSASDWGDSFIPLSWVAARLLHRWDLLSFQPGRNQLNQDIYLLRLRSPFQESKN